MIGHAVSRWRLWRRLLAVASLVLLTALSPAAAEPAPTAAAPSPAELQGLVDTLQDDKARGALIAQLQALIAAQRATTAEPAGPTDFVAGLTHRLNMLAEELLAGVAVVLDAPRLVAWTNAQISDDAARARWGEVILACAVVFGLAVFAEWILRRILARFGQRAPVPHREGRGIRLMFAALGVVVETLPVVGFAGGALLAMAITLPPFATGRAAITILVWATIGARLTVAAAKAVLAPPPAWPSLIPATEETRNYLLIWVRRFTFWTVFGYAVADAAWWLGIPGGVHALMLKGVGLGLALLAIVFMLQNRQTVGGWIGGAASPRAEDGVEDGTEGGAVGWRRLRRHLGEAWHILAIIYIVAIYLVYSLHLEGGSTYVLRATVLSLIAIVGARLLVRFISGLSERGMAVAPDLRTRFPLLEHRANRYLPLVMRLATTVIYGLAALVVLQAWNLGSFAWFETEFGHRVTGALLSSALVLALALVAWEILAATIERNLAALDQAGAPSRARRRTLLPLLRTAALCVIVVIAALIVLSQIGINIAPLLAGAGVIGLAVGFGSQALIKDIITGLFILVEDQIAVGDIVDVGKGHSGVVEAISVRTIRLRDQGGIVHTVPFSEVTSVKNMTKDFTYTLARIGIAYGEDIDRVVEILRGVCDELAEDPDVGPLILNRFDYQGVDSLDDFSVVLLLRVRTVPGKHLVVGRALNRLIKNAFEKNGIASRDPSPIAISGPAFAALGPGAAAKDSDGDAGEDAVRPAQPAESARRTA